MNKRLQKSAPFPRQLIVAGEKPFPIRRLKLQQRLGQGANATTFVARDTRTGRLVALKRLPKSKNDLSELENEIEVLRHLEPECHPYILCYLGYGEDARNYYIVTDYYPGYEPLDRFTSDLRGHPKRRRRLAPRLLKNLVRGLRAIHTADIAHGDVKPTNILIDPHTLAIKYIDFGLACRWQRCTEGFGGTEFYNAPELQTGKTPLVPVDLAHLQNADVYSLGVTLLEFLRTDPQMQRFEEQTPKRVLRLRDRSARYVPWLRNVPPRLVQYYPQTAEKLRFLLQPNPRYRRLPSYGLM